MLGEEKEGLQITDFIWREEEKGRRGEGKKAGREKREKKGGSQGGRKRVLWCLQRMDSKTHAPHTHQTP